ncbi:MAG: signal peptidase I [Clostridia bacterium]|nr:signal peptidase I [Clostridia bacterium]
MNENNLSAPETEEKTENTENQPKPKEKIDIPGTAYELTEMLATVTIVVMLLFAFVLRLNIVDGNSMEQTLSGGEYLAVSDLFYEATPGDIVIIHDISQVGYADPIVKRVIATEGQTVDIRCDFHNWHLYVDGEEVNEDAYRYLATDVLLLPEYKFPITVPEGEIFVLGDNRNHSADSRQIEIGTIDTRCVVGKAWMRVMPFDKAEYFKNPYGN